MLLIFQYNNHIIWVLGTLGFRNRMISMILFTILFFVSCVITVSKQSNQHTTIHVSSQVRVPATIDAACFQSQHFRGKATLKFTRPGYDYMFLRSFVDNSVLNLLSSSIGSLQRMNASDPQIQQPSQTFSNQKDVFKSCFTYV